MTFPKTLHDSNPADPNDLPFCGPDCLGCAIDALGRDLAFYGDVDGHEASVALGMVFFRPGSVRDLEREPWADEGPDGCFEAEMAYERYLEDRYDPDAEADLALHNELWPTYYGCPTDPGASL